MQSKSECSSNRDMFSVLVSKGRFKKLSHLNLDKLNNTYSTVIILLFSLKPYHPLQRAHIFNTVHCNEKSNLYPPTLCLVDLDNVCSWEAQELVWHWRSTKTQNLKTKYPLVFDHLSKKKWALSVYIPLHKIKVGLQFKHRTKRPQPINSD